MSAETQKEPSYLPVTGPTNKNSLNPIITHVVDAYTHIKWHHEENSDGYIAICRKLPKGGMKTRHYQFAEITEELLAEYLADPKNLYFSQQTFFRPNRQAKWARQIRTLYVDLDVYNVKRTVDDTIYDLGTNHFGKTLPRPNRIVESGRGVQLIWDIEPEREFRREEFAAIQDYLIGATVKFGSDSSCRDLAQIFRIAGTVNSKSGKRVKVHHIHNDRYNLKKLVDAYVTTERPKPRRRVSWSATGSMSPSHPLYNHRKSIRGLFGAYIQDIVALTRLRGGDVRGGEAGGVGRHKLLFLTRYYTLLFTGGDDDQAVDAMRRLNDEFKEPVLLIEAERATRSAIRYYEDWANARDEGKQGGLWYRNETLVTQLAITPDEQRHMTAMIGKAEAKRRDIERTYRWRRQAGMKSMDEYTQQRKDQADANLQRLVEAIKADPAATNAALADRLGLSVRQVQRYKKQAKSEGLL